MTRYSPRFLCPLCGSFRFSLASTGDCVHLFHVSVSFMKSYRAFASLSLSFDFWLPDPRLLSSSLTCLLLPATRGTVIHHIWVFFLKCDISQLNLISMSHCFIKLPSFTSALAEWKKYRNMLCKSLGTLKVLIQQQMFHIKFELTFELLKKKHTDIRERYLYAGNIWCTMCCITSKKYSKGCRILRTKTETSAKTSPEKLLHILI